jgi:hypothetical protein
MGRGRRVLASISLYGALVGGGVASAVVFHPSAHHGRLLQSSTVAQIEPPPPGVRIELRDVRKVLYCNHTSRGTVCSSATGTKGAGQIRIDNQP